LQKKKKERGREGRKEEGRKEGKREEEIYLGGRWEDCSEGQPWVGGGGEVGGSWSQAWPLAKAKDLT
jgi:hypothetical protein